MLQDIRLMTRRMQTYDEKYNKGETIQKPDRTDIKVPTFKVEIAPEMAVDEFDIENAQIDMGVESYGEFALEEVEAPDAGTDPVSLVDAAYKFVKKQSFWFRTGSPEYKEILDGLDKLRDHVKDETKDMQQTIPECRKILAVMDQYIDRKMDEKDAAANGERKNSRKDAV